MISCCMLKPDSWLMTTLEPMITGRKNTARASVRPLNFWLRTRASVMDRATTMGNEVNRLDSDSMI